ncbi:unnamed protein product, partial [Rotaria magnacalcarata]
QEREETRERYSRALLTLFVSCRSVHDLCALNQTWAEALEVQKPLVSPASLNIIENIQILHECKHDRNEHLRQVLVEAQSDNSIDHVLIPNYYEEDQHTEEDDHEQLLQILSSQNPLGIIDNQLLMCVPGCGDTGKSQLIRAITKLRTGQSTIEDYRLLCARIVGNPKLQASLRQKPWNESPILVFRNTLRSQINNRAVLNKAMEMELRPMVCVAQDYFQQKIIDDLRLRKTILELPDYKTEHLPGYLPLVPGMSVLLTENVATELGLSNGTRGIFH